MIPIGKNIVVKVIDEEINTESGFLLSGDDAAKLRYRKAKVVSVGTDVSAVLAEDIIHFDKGQSYAMIIDGIALTIIQERDVVVVLNR